MTRDIPRLGLRRLAVRARLAGWSVRDIASWLLEDPQRVRRWLRQNGRTTAGRHGRYVFDVWRGRRLQLTRAELERTGAAYDLGDWIGRGGRGVKPVPEAVWLLLRHPAPAE